MQNILAVGADKSGRLLPRQHDGTTALQTEKVRVMGLLSRRQNDRINMSRHAHVLSRAPASGDSKAFRRDSAPSSPRTAGQMDAR